MLDQKPKIDSNLNIGWSGIKASIRPQEDGISADIPENWRQGRTAYGGLTSALMLAGAKTKFDDLPPLRSALINFVGPVTENPIFRASLERKGRNVTSISATAKIGEQVVGRADFVFGAARTSNLAVDYSSPEASKPESCDPFTPKAVHDFVPRFFHNFDTRLIAGARPMMGDEGYIRVWSRHKDETSREGVDSLLCIGDVLPPAAMPLLRKFAPVSSMTWIFNLLVDAPRTEDGWWHIESKLTAAQGGYSSQVMRIWNTEGQLVVEGLQSIAIFDD